jgi:hypothetical protein
MGVLANKARPKVVVGYSQVLDTVKALVHEQYHTSRAYTLQTCCLILLLFYSGIRLASILPPQDQYTFDWESKILRWKVRLNKSYFYSDLNTL